MDGAHTDGVLSRETICAEEINQKEKNMSVISMKQLGSRCSFRHRQEDGTLKRLRTSTRERNGIYIIDLQQSVGMVDDGCTMQSLTS